MTDRRRYSRFVIPESSHGAFRAMQDVCVEQIDGELVVVVSDTALRQGEGLTLELPRGLGARAVVRVSVVSCTPVWLANVRRHRVVLQSPIAVEAKAPVPDSPFMKPRTALPALGVLVRRIPVRVRDISTTGCQLESLDPLPDTQIGQLEVFVEGERHQEPVRVTRAVRLPGGAWPYRAGAQFLALGAPLPTSVRNAVARMEIVEELLPRAPGGRPAANEAEPFSAVE